jgi:hypothetical protein
MAFIHSPRIVTNGLIYHVDFGNPKSYASGSAILNDLTNRNPTGTLVSIAYTGSGGGAMVTNQVGYASASINPISTRNATIAAAVYVVGGVSYTPIYMSRALAGACGLNLHDAGTNVGYHWADSITTYGFDSGLTAPVGKWSYMAVSVEDSRAILYLNGATSINSVSHASGGFSFGTIGLDPDFGRNFNGSIGIVSIYSRALTVDELNQNFNALRGRYGV